MEEAVPTPQARVLVVGNTYLGTLLPQALQLPLSPPPPHY
jgi:hypothetical protein